jgi:hypothetical protein
MTKPFKIFKKLITIIFSILIGFLIILTVVLFAYSPGKIEPYVDNNGKPITGSIAEKIFVKIGGVTQGMFIKSKNINNPILLY